MPTVRSMKIYYNACMDTVSYNRAAWDKQVEKGIEWSIPVTPEQIQAARQGNWQIVLTPVKPVPANWFPSPLAGLVVEVNRTLDLSPEAVNQEPYGGGWLALVAPADWPAARASLLDATAYLAAMKAQAEEELQK